jgi:hypothetical protein
MLGNLVMDEGGSAGRKRKFFFKKILGGFTGAD